MTQPRYANTTDSGRTYENIPGFEGQTFASVTTILGAYAKPALVPWAAKCSAEYAVKRFEEWSAVLRSDGIGAAIDLIKKAPATARDAAADLGTRVHKACEEWPIGDTYDPDVALYVARYIDFIEEYKPDFLAKEITVLHPGLGYAGTLDMVVRIGGKTYIGDIKTGGVWPDAALQMAAYANAPWRVNGDATEPLDLTIDGAFVLELKPTRPTVHWCNISESTFAAFVNCLDLYRWGKGPARSVFGEEWR